MKIIINIFGPSTAGKSTVTEMLQQRIERLYTVDFDVVKRQLAGYYWKRDSEVANRLTYDVLRSVSATELPVLALLPPAMNEAEYSRVVGVASQTGRQLINIEITAPKDVLMHRYRERMRTLRESGSTWKIKTLDEFEEKLKQLYYSPVNARTFDSSILSQQEITEEIIAILKESTAE